VPTRSSAAVSSTAATGTATDVTVPAGTTLSTTGSASIRSSAVLATFPTTGCRSPVGEGAGGRASGMGVSAPVKGAVRDETDDVTPSRREPESREESAVAAEAERVSHVAVTAPASRNGRRARHGDRALAMRTTPSTVETYDLTTLRLVRAASLGKRKLNPANLLICHPGNEIGRTGSNLFTRMSQGGLTAVLQWASFG
jgi:hypothetical protein